MFDVVAVLHFNTETNLQVDETVLDSFYGNVLLGNNPILHFSSPEWCQHLLPRLTAYFTFCPRCIYALVWWC